MSLSVTGRSRASAKWPRRRVRDAPAQDLAVRIRVGDLPECAERCIEVHRGLPRLLSESNRGFRSIACQGQEHRLEEARSIGLKRRASSCRMSQFIGPPAMEVSITHVFSPCKTAVQPMSVLYGPTSYLPPRDDWCSLQKLASVPASQVYC